MKTLTTKDFNNIKSKVEEGLTIREACKALNIHPDDYYTQASEPLKREISMLGSCNRSGAAVTRARKRGPYKE